MFGRNEKYRKVLSRSIFFNEEHFRNSTPIPPGASAIDYYLKNWKSIGVDPSPHFDSQFYLDAYKDVGGSNFSPLVHYLLYGWREKRSPSQKFDRAGFLGAHPNVDPTKIDAAEACILLYGNYQWNDPRVRRQLREGEHEIQADTMDLSGMDERMPSPYLQPRHEVAVSVVIPTYNRADLIENTATEILATIGDDPVELVVIDDGSIDQTSDVLRMLQMKSSKLNFQRTENRGPGPARNLGASVANGDVVVFLGDDTRPTTPDLFRAHYAAHQAHRSLGNVVLGKVVWPDARFDVPNFVMSLIQGDGQQQFGYKYMKPWQKYSPWLFYTANASVKSGAVDDWSTGGFSDQFTLYGFEDGEFAYRLSQKFEDFGVYYTPNAVVDHHHSYDVASFLRRQVSCGYMMDVLFKLHPELKKQILDPGLYSILEDEVGRDCDPGVLRLSPHYSSVIQGIKSWSVILDKHHGLGSQNWHADFMNAVFQLAFLDGYLTLQNTSPSAQVNAYRYLLEDFKLRIKRAVQTEVIGDIPNFSFI